MPAPAWPVSTEETELVIWAASLSVPGSQRVAVSRIFLTYLLPFSRQTIAKPPLLDGNIYLFFFSSFEMESHAAQAGLQFSV